MTNSLFLDQDSVNLLVINGKAYNLNDEPTPEVIQILTQLLEGTKTPKTPEKPHISQVYSIDDFERIAEQVIDKDSWNYYRTGASDEITLRENVAAWKRIFLRPRVLQNVEHVDTSATILGKKTSVPFYITAFYGSFKASTNRTQGELPLIRQSAKADVIQMLPSNSSFSFEDFIAESAPGQRLWLQIYTGRGDKEVSELIKKAEDSNKIEALFFTVDMAQIGRRETELRQLGTSEFNNNTPTKPALDWDGMAKWAKSTKLKVFLKGVQTAEDAVTAAHYGFDGILISNHGGRQLDTARSGIEVLAEVVPALKSKNLYDKIDVFVDGGVRRGTDVAKAIALGAKAVGLGRPFLYPLVSYGDEGVEKAIKILKDDFELTLRLLGVDKVSKLDESYVDTTDLSRNRAN